MKRALIVVAVVAALLSAGGAEAKKKNVIQAAGGTTIPGLGLVIDASYDPRFDTLVPGYKLITVVLENASFNVIGLSPDKDLWEIRLQGEKRPIRAINDLRSEAPQAWAALPQKLKDTFAYPLYLPIGAREVIDLFVPEVHDLELFTELDITLKALGGRLEILVRQ